MNGLKENSTVETPDESTPQLEFVLSVQDSSIEKSSDLPLQNPMANVIELHHKETTNVSSSPVTVVGPEFIQEIEILEEKKSSLLLELERLNQYTQQKQKKLQEAKSFIEQYERVVVNKKHYIEEVEQERSAIEKDIYQLKTIKDKKLNEIEELNDQINNVKKIVIEEKNNLQAWEIKIHEKRVEYSQADNMYHHFLERKERLVEECRKQEDELASINTYQADKKNEILLAEEQLQQINHRIKEKKNELDTLISVLEKFLSGHKKIESELLQSIERLKSDECTWRLLVDEKTRTLDKLEIQISAISDELKNHVNEFDQIKSQINYEKNKLLNIGDQVQKEILEAEKWEVKVFKYREEVEVLKNTIHHLEMENNKSSAEVEMLRNRRQLEEQESFKIRCQKEQLLDEISLLEQKKISLHHEIGKNREDALNSLQQEISLWKQEEKSFRAIREETFKEELIKEKKQMKEIFWFEVDSRVNSLCEEVSNYLLSCLQLNLNKGQKDKLNNHIFHLVKYYHGLDINKFSYLSFFSSFLRRNEPFLILMSLVLTLAVISLQLLN